MGRHISTIVMALPARVLKRSSYDLRSLAEDSPPLQVVVVGIGRMGMPTACMFANAGVFVTGCDTNAHLVKCVERGENYLPDVADLERIFNKVTKNGGFKATTDTTAAVHSAEVYPLPSNAHSREGRKKSSFVRLLTCGSQNGWIWDHKRYLSHCRIYSWAWHCRNRGGKDY